jgi:eukaryotic-like serine/threonine-protein kinase
MTTNTASPLEAGDNVAAPVNAGEVVAEKYLIERTLGVGGMGVVVAARDQLLDRRVAIKFLLPKLAGSDTAVQRFTREARAATRVTSEHVVRLLEIEKLPSGTPFFVMEYLEGSDLRALLRERGALSASLAVDYALQALQAVAEGHVRGIVHRDIKPGNLFLTSRADGTPLIKVLDFGIAKTLESDSAESTSLTSSDDVRLGSPAYMPPEQLQNPRDVDTRSDIWSLGATLYELLCGRPPFEGTGYLELASRILSAPPIPISQRPMASKLPNGLEAVLHKCLEKERSLRYANAGELAVALAPFGSDDARMSLARVSGLFGSQSSIPALTRSIPHDAASSTATLEVPSAPTNGDQRRTSDIGAVASTHEPRRGRSWLILAAAAVGIFGVFVLRGPASVVPRLSDAPPARVEPVEVGTAAAPAPVTPAPVSSPPPAAVAEPAPPSTGAVAVEPAPPSRKAAATTAANRVVDATRVVVSQPIASSASPALQPSAAPKASTGAAAATPPPATGLGRSEEIERLIQVRR